MLTKYISYFIKSNDFSEVFNEANYQNVFGIPYFFSKLYNPSLLFSMLLLLTHTGGGMKHRSNSSSGALGGGHHPQQQHPHLHHMGGGGNNPLGMRSGGNNSAPTTPMNIKQETDLNFPSGPGGPGGPGGPQTQLIGNNNGISSRTGDQSSMGSYVDSTSFGINPAGCRLSNTSPHSNEQLLFMREEMQELQNGKKFSPSVCEWWYWSIWPDHDSWYLLAHMLKWYSWSFVLHVKRSSDTNISNRYDVNFHDSGWMDHACLFEFDFFDALSRSIILLILIIIIGGGFVFAWD